MQANIQNCDYCHQKPKFGGHSYCSKTCATQAATLCNYCHKKPKFQNYEFCGKNCAALAKPRGGGGAQAQGPQPTAATAPKHNPVNPNPPPPQPKPIVDPIQVAKLVVQQIPQLQASSLAPQINSSLPTIAPVSNSGVVKAPLNNPFLHVSTNPPITSTTLVTSNISQTDPALASQVTVIPESPLECLIPGCGQPVHISSGSKLSDYCSMRHREEAVNSGLVSPCIMCLKMPQSETDYFCSRECRQDAMHKPAMAAL